MFTFTTVIGSVCAAGAGNASAEAQAAPDAKQAKLLVAGLAMRPQGKDMALTATMVLSAPGEEDRTRSIIAFEKRNGPDAGAFRLQFSSPKDLEGTGLLSIRSDAETQQHWVFASGAASARKLADKSAMRSFLDTQLRFSELVPESFALQKHTLFGEDTVDDRLCAVVDSRPLGATASSYARRRMWIDETYMLALRVEYFADPDAGEPERRYEVQKVQKVQDYWTVMASAVTDIASGRSTRIIVGSVAYDQGLPDSLFTPEALAAPSTGKDYKP